MMATNAFWLNYCFMDKYLYLVNPSSTRDFFEANRAAARDTDDQFCTLNYHIIIVYAYLRQEPMVSD